MGLPESSGSRRDTRDSARAATPVDFSAIDPPFRFWSSSWFSSTDRKTVRKDHAIGDGSSVAPRLSASSGLFILRGRRISAAASARDPARDEAPAGRATGSTSFGCRASAARSPRRSFGRSRLTLVGCSRAALRRSSTVSDVEQPSGSLVTWTKAIYALHAFSLLTGLL